MACVSVDVLTLTYVAALVIHPVSSLKDDPTLTTRDAARLLGISVSTAQKWIESGALESWKTPGGHRRMRQSAVIALLEERTAMSADAVGSIPQELRAERCPPYPVPRDEAARLRMVGRTGLLDTTDLDIEAAFRAAVDFVSRATAQ